MVTRNSQEAQFGQPGVQRIAGTGVGAARPDFEGNRTSHDFAAPVDTGASSARLLSTIMGTVTQLGVQAMSKGLEEAYLEGAAKAGTIQSEKELEGNPLTSAWKKQGYRDTMGRVAIAESEAQVMADMPKMRMVSPDEYNEYLAQRRAELIPTLEGMSSKQRTAVFQNLLLNDRAAIKKHASEHAKFQFEVEQKSIKASLTVQKSAMDVAQTQNDGASYRTATEAMFAAINAAVVQNPKLNDMQRGGILSEVMASSLESNHQQLYQMLKTTELPLPDGSKGPMSNLMTWDDDVKMSKQYRESVQRKESEASFGYNSRMSQIEAEFDDTSAPLMSFREMTDYVERGVRQGWVSSGAQKSFQDKWHNAAAKRSASAPLATAWASGDQGTMMRLNKTDEEGLDAFLSDPKVKALPPAERVAQLATIGIAQGRPAALKQLGKDLAPAVAQIGVAEEIDPANMTMLNTTLGIIDKAERNGASGLLSTMMSSYPQDTQDMLTMYRGHMQRGMGTTEALNLTRTRMTEYRKMDAQTRAAMGAQNAKDDADIINGYKSRDFLDSLWLGTKAVFSTSAANEMATSPKAGWGENPERVAEVTESMRFAAAEELKVLSDTRPWMAKEDRDAAVRATLINRTVQTREGPVLVPRGMTLQSFFGVSGSTGGERVAAALDSLQSPRDGARLVFTTTSNGQLMFRELGEDSRQLRSGFIDPTTVAAKVSEQQQAEAAKAGRVHGAGVTKGGFTFNGDNTQGLGNESMYEVRTHLIQEGVYKRESTGDRAKDQAASNFFMQETDKAAKEARNAIRTVGRTSQPLFAMLTEMAITGGKPLDDKEYRDFIGTLRGQDQAAALQALSSTPAFKRADEKARTRYVGVVNKLTKGM